MTMAGGAVMVDTDASETIEAWRRHYNDVRPHRSLNGMPPSQYARRAA